MTIKPNRATAKKIGLFLVANEGNIWRCCSSAGFPISNVIRTEHDTFEEAYKRGLDAMPSPIVVMSPYDHQMYHCYEVDAQISA